MTRSDAPPALSPKPQFTPEYWQNVPRATRKAKIARVTNKGEYVEIALTNGAAFQRHRSEIQQLLTVNLDVDIEAIGNGAIITGMFVPNIGWAFRMTAEDLADYTRRLSEAQYAKAQATMQRMVEHVASTLVPILDDLEFTTALDDEDKQRVGIVLATAAIEALEQGPDDTASNT